MTPRNAGHSAHVLGRHPWRPQSMQAARRGSFLMPPAALLFPEESGRGSTNVDPASGADGDCFAFWLNVHLPSRPGGFFCGRTKRLYAKRALAMLRRWPPLLNETRQHRPPESPHPGPALSPAFSAVLPQSHAKRALAMLRRWPPLLNGTRQHRPPESPRPGPALSPPSPRLFPMSHAKRAKRCFAGSRPR